MSPIFNGPEGKSITLEGDVFVSIVPPGRLERNENTSLDISIPKDSISPQDLETLRNWVGACELLSVVTSKDDLFYESDDLVAEKDRVEFSDMENFVPRDVSMYGAE